MRLGSPTGRLQGDVMVNPLNLFLRSRSGQGEGKG
jgi:hypothetical protein